MTAKIASIPRLCWRRCRSFLVLSLWPTTYHGSGGWMHSVGFGSG
uniref:Uncharacterized protein n=1 Tax=Setaria viridis TaxID=4556 RepID=A0A4U6TW20_SETVI|nr:hypothetical protein SEVIR_7G149206v2 [Setaria viridis]